ncbi:MAG: SnoaL-like domain-containing protein [Flammeovirgaceae bacterium]
MSYLEKATDIYNMVNSGQLMEAFEKYYHEDVVMVEASGEKREGKDVNRKAEQDFLASVKEFHNAGVTAVTSNEAEAVTTVEAWMEVTFQNAPGPIKLEQVAVQKWQGDQIIHERFYYNVQEG